MTNGNTDDSVQILGFKIGADWDLLSNLVFSLKAIYVLIELKVMKMMV